MKKNFKKVLADWKKFFTFALANQEQDDRLRILRKRKERSSLTIRYNNQVRKKNQSVNFKLNLSIRTHKHTMESLILAQDER